MASKQVNLSIRLVADFLAREGIHIKRFDIRTVYEAWCSKHGGNRFLTRKALQNWFVARAQSSEIQQPPSLKPKQPVRHLPIRSTPVTSTVDPRTKAFLLTREWRELRYRVLKRYGATCQCCGRSKGVVIHVDHIKPRHTHPHLALVESNLQVLCEDCNIGKGAWDNTDWR